MSADKKQTLSILGLCNPLLDVTAYVEQELLDKYGLKANNVILAGEEHKNLCKELVEKYPVEYTAGGSAQNVMRIAAGVLKQQKVDARVMFSGCISDDEFGSLMSKKAQEDGVIVNYSICKTEPTGTCAVCLTEQGKNRSLCAFLGASQKFSDQHLKDNWDELVANTGIIYISGFLIAVSPASFHLLGEHVAKSENKSKRFCLNLSAPYVSAVFGSEIEKVMKYVDVLFGNDDEALAYAQHKKWDTTNIEEIATRIAQDEKVKTDVGRLVIITQGERPIICAQQVVEGGDSKVQISHFECEPIPDNEMVDSNGAGDSFAGAFLSQYMQGAPLDYCFKVGSYAAREVIKLSGMAVPDFSNLPQQ